MAELDLQFNDWVQGIENTLGKEEWVTVWFGSRRDTLEWVTMFSALIPNRMVSKSLNDTTWDLRIGGGFPGFSFTYRDGREVGKYHRFPDSGIEPLVFHRSFHGIKPDYMEVSAGFRHYFNFYEDKKESRLISIDNDGDEEDAALISEREIRIKLKFIKEFLAAKKMSLAIFFDIMRFSPKTLEELGIKERHDVIKKENSVYSLGVRKHEMEIYGRPIKSQGWINGKKIIPGLKDFKPILFKENERYEEFIINVDAEGKEILHTCNPDELSNYFGRNPGSPHFLTPVFFRREVLSRYYGHPEKYSVEDGYLRCAGLWGLRMDNDHSEHVVVFLGDLGESLSLKEQQYWKRFNITPQGLGISRTAWKRGFEAEFADPEKSDLYFKQKFSSFKKKWNRQFGWDLFKPLRAEDRHHLKSLRLPLTNDQKEFDEQVGSLTKILIDSLNEEGLGKGVAIQKENPKGIDKFEAFLKSKNLRFPEMVVFLGDLQALRSAGIAHRKGKNFDKIAKEFGVGEKELRKVFDDILIKAIRTLNSLDKALLKEEQEDAF